MATQVLSYAVDTTRRSQVIPAPAGSYPLGVHSYGGQLYVTLVGDRSAAYSEAFTLTLAAEGSDATQHHQAFFFGHAELAGKPVLVFLQPVATASLGSFSAMHWSGVWSAGSDYNISQATRTAAGGVYVCNTAVTAAQAIEPGVTGGWEAYWDLLSSPTTSWETGTAYYDGVTALYVVYGADGAWEATKADGSNTLSTGTQAGTKPTTLVALQGLTYS